MTKPIWALGLMSGTSMDGVDAAFLRTDGVSVFEFGATAEVPAQSRDRMLAIAADWRRHLDAPGEDVAAAQRAVHDSHLAAIEAAVASQGHAPDLIGFHGQTLGHAPADRITWQLGDGAALARAAGAPVAWDFRSADVAAGGQGAPLAPFYHHALARFIGAGRPLAFLNIGGVANITYVDPRIPDPAAKGALLAFDTGPGNALIDDFMRQRTGEAMDRDGAHARLGRVDEALFHAVYRRFLAPYVERPPAKSLDRGDFDRVLAHTAQMSTEDGAAFLTRLTVQAISDSLTHCPSPPERILVCGGGRRNPALMEGLAAAPVETAGLNGDMLEAQAFAYLATRTAAGLPVSAPATTGAPHPIKGGRIDRP